MRLSAITNNNSSAENKLRGARVGFSYTRLVQIKPICEKMYTPSKYVKARNDLVKRRCDIYCKLLDKEQASFRKRFSDEYKLVSRELWTINHIYKSSDCLRSADMIVTSCKLLKQPNVILGAAESVRESSRSVSQALRVARVNLNKLEDRVVRRPATDMRGASTTTGYQAGGQRPTRKVKSAPMAIRLDQNIATGHGNRSKLDTPPALSPKSIIQLSLKRKSLVTCTLDAQFNSNETDRLRRISDRQSRINVTAAIKKNLA